MDKEFLMVENGAINFAFVSNVFERLMQPQLASTHSHCVRNLRSSVR